MGKEYQTEFPAKGSGVIDSEQPTSDGTHLSTNPYVSEKFAVRT